MITWLITYPENPDICRLVTPDLLLLVRLALGSLFLNMAVRLLPFHQVVGFIRLDGCHRSDSRWLLDYLNLARFPVGAFDKDNRPLY